MKPTSIAVTNDMQSITNLAIDPIRAFRSAFAKAKKAFKPVLKTQDNPFFHSKYASLSDIHNAVDEPLLQNGFTLHQLFEPTDLGTILLTKLCHVDGGDETSRIRLATKDDSDPQKVKSAATYYRRIALEALLGIATEDDDGNRAAESSPNTPLINPNSKEFRYKFGKYSGKSFEEVEAVEPGGNQSYIAWLMSKDREKNKPIQQAFWAWEKFHAASKGHKDFEEPPPHEDMDIPF